MAQALGGLRFTVYLYSIFAGEGKQLADRRMRRWGARRVTARVIRIHGCRASKAKTPPFWGGVFVWSMRSLTITYFHTGIRTIIGVESFL
ncbi:hypothetical protein, partial [Caballeronia zhejiangensis]|uniref:hypothetical protein n=1 Tax=Caballeronia zhejiangensis TaxID=871203 RepID=UPI001F2D3738